MSTGILRVLGVMFAAALLVASCGDDDTTTGQTGGTAVDDTGDGETDGDDTASDAPLQEADTDLGPTLVDADGFTLYGFTPDEGGTPTCTDSCAELWPPLTVDSEELPEGLDSSVFSVVEHPSGDFQLAAGGWPLYLYAPDSAPGDVTGQGVGGNWFAVAPDGTLIQGPEDDGARSGSGGTDSDETDSNGLGY